MQLWFYLDIARLVPLIAILFYGAIKDLKHASVTNYAWTYAPIGCFIMLIEYISYAPSLLPYAFLSLGVTVILALALFFIPRIGWGGADSKALITIAVCFPLGTNLYDILTLDAVSRVLVCMYDRRGFSCSTKEERTNTIPTLPVPWLHNLLLHLNYVSTPDFLKA